MTPLNKWSFAAAALWLAMAAMSLPELLESRNLSEDWVGPVQLLTGTLFLVLMGTHLTKSQNRTLQGFPTKSRPVMPTG